MTRPKQFIDTRFRWFWPYRNPTTPKGLPLLSEAELEKAALKEIARDAPIDVKWSVRGSHFGVR